MKLKKRVVALLIVFVIFTSMVEITPIEAVGPWLEGYFYRKSHTITGSSDGAQTDYQVGIKAYFGEGTDGTETVNGIQFGKVYLNSHAQNDFDDVNFTSSDMETPLDYWLQEKADNDYAIFWVEVPAIPEDPDTVDIYVYYGNSTVSTSSNGIDTFRQIYHDMEGTPGNTPTGYTDDSSASCSFEINGAVSRNGDESARSLDNNNNGWAHGTLASDVASNFQSVTYWVYMSHVDSIHTINFFRTGITDIVAILTFSNDNKVYAFDGVASTEIMGSFDAETWYVVEVRFDYIATTYEVYINGNLEANNFDWFTGAISDCESFRFTTGKTFASATKVSYFDDVFERKYVEPEPSHTSWGSEEEVYFYTDYLFISGFYFENGTKAPEEYATVTLENGTSFEIFLNGTTEETHINATIMRVSWPIEYDGAESIRFIDITQDNETRTLFVPEDDFDAYVFTIRDYTARLGIGKSYIEAYRVINATNQIIERKEIITTLNEEVLQLVIGKVYNIKIRFGDNSTSDFGLRTLTSDTTITLPILDLAFSQKAQTTFKYVTVEATRPIFTTIVLSYNDTRLETNWANVTIEFMNGTVAASQDYSTDAFTYTYMSAAHNLTYKVRVKFDHGEFGLLPDWVAFLEGNVTYSDKPDVGAAGSIGGMATTDLIGIIMISIVIGAGTYRNSEAVLLVAALMAGMFSAMGFVSFDVTLIEVVIGIVLIYNLVRSSG